MSYISLHNHTHYSLLRGFPEIKDLVKKAKSQNMTHVAITDKNNMYGAIEFYKACQKHEIKPIIGLEISVKNRNEIFEMILLAKNEYGYKNLMRIVSELQIKDRDGQNLFLTFEDFEKLKSTKPEYNTENCLSDIFVLSGGNKGELSYFLKNINEDNIDKSYTEALNIYNKWNDIFTDNFYIEINTQNNTSDNKNIFDNLTEFIIKNNLQEKSVLTSNTYYTLDSDKSAHKVFINIDSEIDGAQFYRDYFGSESYAFMNNAEIDFWIKSNENEQIKDLLYIAKDNSQKVANEINIQLELGKWTFPFIEYKTSYKEDLRQMAYEGLKSRNIIQEDRYIEDIKNGINIKPEHKTIIDRLEYELKVIDDKGFSPYFMIVNDLIKYARENNILTNIRGSVAGSIVTYLLRITKSNPIEYKLPFERFLNPERPSAPDIDMDYADNKRDDVLNYSRSKYGYDKVAQIGTFGTMASRAAIRDVARAMGYPYIVGDKISKMIPLPKQGFYQPLSVCIEEIEDLKKMYEEDNEAKQIIDMAKKIEGKVRHIGVHAAGTVLSPTEIFNFSPIQYDPKGEGKIITQYDMHSIEDAGLIKFDFLGIRNLSILRTAMDMVKEQENIDIDIENIPLDDKRTFDLISKGRTIGLFQLNGGGMTKFLKELKPSTIFDINAMVALYRPGPIEIIPEYINRKHGKSKIEYLDPRLEKILDQSFGLIVYQDDVMMIAIELAGYSWLEADKLRKAMGKKVKEEMEAQKEKLFSGFKAHGLSQSKMQDLWQRIEPFAAYGFNKAHAASYGRVAYQTAYMKANYPVEYMCSIMINESGDTDKISEIVNECNIMNIKVLPPDINLSNINFSIIKEFSDNNYGKIIRFGFNTIKNLGENISEAIVSERNKNGIFVSLENFISRVKHKDLNKKSIEALAKSGALDSLNLTQQNGTKPLLYYRRVVLENIEEILNFNKINHEHHSQYSLFDIMDNGNSLNTWTLKPVIAKDKKEEEDWKKEELSWEKELLGLYISGFPLDPWKKKIENREINIRKIKEEIVDGTAVAFAVVIENIKITKTKKGDQMALINVRDFTDNFEVAVFPETYKKYKAFLLKDKPLVLHGRAATKNEEKTFILDSINFLEDNDKD